MRVAAGRNLALDAFRGISVAVMLLVDAPPDFEAIYPILVHSPWQGITVADLAFPGFVFAMGASAACSLDKSPGEGWEKRRGRVLRRGVLLFLLGVLFNELSPVFSWLLLEGYDAGALYGDAVLHGRLFGVLQRLALVYMAGMFLALCLKENRRILLAALSLLLASSAGFHLYSPEAPFDRLCNVSQAVDLVFPGADHVYPHYGLPFDPEGLYGTAAATANMLFGVLAGRVLTGTSGGGRRRIFFGGVLLLALGGLWSLFDMIGKPLWTAPYALLTSGGNAVCLAGLAQLFGCFPSAAGWFRPFCAFGRNPIFFYFATNIGLIFLWTLPSPVEGLSAYPWIWQSTTKGLVSIPFSAALHALLWCGLWWPLAEFFYRRGMVIKL